MKLTIVVVLTVCDRMDAACVYYNVWILRYFPENFTQFFHYNEEKYDEIVSLNRILHWKKY